MLKSLRSGLFNCSYLLLQLSSACRSEILLLRSSHTSKTPLLAHSFPAVKPETDLTISRHPDEITGSTAAEKILLNSELILQTTSILRTADQLRQERTPNQSESRFGSQKVLNPISVLFHPIL
jgi:hypothetical protein